MNKIPISKISNKIYRFFRKSFLLIGLVFLLLVIFTTLITVLNSKDKIFTSPNDLDGKYTVLVLGTSKYSSSGKENIFYKNRINSVVNLYKAHKIKQIILSGHNDIGYDEPEKMFEDLQKADIPTKMLIKDKRGDRTVNSILNLKEIYNISDRVLIVSQTFHIQRALLLANIYGIKALGFSAPSPLLKNGIKTYLREIIARIVLLKDILYY